MIRAEQIQTLADFLNNNSEHLARLKKTKAPEALTINGRAELVVMDAEAFEQLAARIEESESIAAIREGLESADRGELKPAEVVFREMKARYGLSD